ncbi:Ribonuclease H-like domain [Cinara cedri]|uniref:Ribonuclease H-like domain n=1 Tax=Cinara cedri TaxID=506608 RepID=A0A5E4MEM8_9HEMI|nr:Ribonuclease H-like domain [Cinara cedri]
MAIKVVNYVKTRPVKARFFQKLCEEMGVKHYCVTTLLFYCNSKWLSKGNVLSRVFELRQELYSYLNGKGFWNSIKVKYPEVSNKALGILIPFATSYLCEAGFSAVAELKSKYRSRLNMEKEMRVAVTTSVPNFKF